MAVRRVEEGEEVFFKKRLAWGDGSQHLSWKILRWHCKANGFGKEKYGNKKKKKEIHLWCHNNTFVGKQLLSFLFLSFFIWKTTISCRIIRLLFCQYNNQCRLRRFVHFLWNGLKNVGNLKSFGKLFKWVSSDWRVDSTFTEIRNDEMDKQ